MNQKTSGNPWLFVPALFFLEGIPYFIVSTISVTMFKKLGVANDQIGLWTSLITWPWIVKMLWGPLVESTSTKRKWILGTQIAAIVTMALVSLTITSENFLYPTLVVLTVLAFLSATHDIAADGFYLLALAPEDQAYFVGIRSTAYRLANVFCNGGLVYLAGVFENTPGVAVAEAWRNIILIGAGVYLLFVVLGYSAMPKPRQDKDRVESFPFREAFVEYFSQSKLAVILGFILTYRFGE
ncbi:MAG TPA: MFS transporter, partial [Candidatus Ozemobacteraceae bacterium]|nr:MFS transporter [Candidatus Ozemobacteraceae bacterium]